MQIDYDPAQISYQELFEIFWESHNPRTPSFSRQYAEIVFYHNDEQRQIAQQRQERAQAGQGKQLWTEIVPVSTFYMAEDYHQKYQLRRVRELEAELRAIYPDPTDLANSTVAARLNGFLGGNGTLEQLQAELDSYGLSPKAASTLLDVMARRWGEQVYEACPLPDFE